MPARLNDDTELTMPLRNLLSIVAGVALGVWAYFGVVERLNNIETQLEKLVQEVESGSAPFDQQQELTLQWYAQRITELESQVEELRARRE